MSPTLMSLVWLIAILVLIPVALLLLKRSGMATGGTSNAVPGAPRLVASLGVGAQQRVITLEVGEGASRRWLVLGVSPQAITPLHTLESPPVVVNPEAVPVPPFAQVLGRAMGRVVGRGRDAAV